MRHRDLATLSPRPERLTLAVLMCGVGSLALSDFVSPFYWSLSVIAALLRLWLGHRFYLSEMQASMIGWLGFIWVALELLLGRELVVAFTDFLLILALAVVVEAPTPRNHLHRMIVGLFLMLAAAVLTDSVLFALPLFAMLWFFWRAAACLYGLQQPGGDLPVAPVRIDLPWLVAAGVLATLLFLSLPRFEFHTLLTARQPQLRTSGFSDRVTLGDFALHPDERVVMRVESDQSNEPADAFRKQITNHYWRGVALSTFTGHGWQMGSHRFIALIPANRDTLFVQPDAGAQRLQITLYREASDHGYLHLPQDMLMLRGFSAPLRMDIYGAVSFSHPPTRRLRLAMQLASGVNRITHLRPPSAIARDSSKIPPALRAWVAQQLGPAPVSAQERRRGLMQLIGVLRSWDYDLNVAVDAQRPVASFLRNRRGHCELFATTLALAARELGFASRVVNGYYGGEWNDVGDFLLLRQKHAHSWVEVWIEDRWLRLDPTPASRWQYDTLVFASLDQLWETVKLTWFRHVLSFENSDRGQIFHQLETLMVKYGFWLFIPVFLAVGLRRWFREARSYLLRRQWGRSDCTKLRTILDRWLRQRGVLRLHHQPYSDLPVPEGIRPELWQQFIGLWEAQLYGAEPVWKSRDLNRHLRALLKQC